MDALSPEGIVVTHAAFLVEYLLSNIMSRDQQVVLEFLSAFGLASWLNIGMIMRYDKTFCVSIQTFSNPTKKPMFICHLGSHFFLEWKVNARLPSNNDLIHVAVKNFVLWINTSLSLDV